jgi:tRNA nucleotidyltransferase (CCA-adding enzyme)
VLVEAVCARLRVPLECRDLAIMTAREHGNLHRALELNATTMVTLFGRCDGFRKPERFAQMLLAAESDARGRIGNGVDCRARPYPQAPYLLAALAAARGVDAGAVAAGCGENKQRIPEAVYEARVRAVKAIWRQGAVEGDQHGPA